jgi:hypothetical protein
MNDLNAMLAAMGISLKLDIWDVIVMIVLSLPPVFVLFSRRVSGGTKVLWFVLTSFFSWLAYAPFLYVTREKGDRPPPAGDAPG